MTNKIDTVLKAITDRLAGALLSDTIKNPILNVNTITSVLSARSYPTEDLQCLTHIHCSINAIIIHPIVDNHRFNNSLSGARVGKIKGRTYNLLPRGPVYEAILKKKITRKEDIEGNFKIPYNIGGLKHMNALVDKRGVLVEVEERESEHVYPIDFVILDIKENEKRPFILGTPFLTTAKAVIKFDKGTITLRYGKNKISFNRIPKSLCKDKKGIKNDIEPIAPTMTLNKLVLEWVIRSLGWHLEEIHVTWAHLEKKLTRLQTCTKIHQEVLFLEHGDGVTGIKRRRHDLSGDDVWILVTASQRDDDDVMFIEIVKKNDDSRKEEPEAGGLEVEYFDIFPTRSEFS
ncbi:CAAX amino terminal protease [Tanacetum coccineum]